MLTMLRQGRKLIMGLSVTYGKQSEKAVSFFDELGGLGEL